MKTKKKRSAKEREHFKTVTLGQAFCDDWNAANKIEQSVLSDAAVRYSLTREEPQPDERAKIGMAWGGVKCEIDRINKQKERLAAVRSVAGKTGAEARWGKRRADAAPTASPSPETDKPEEDAR